MKKKHKNAPRPAETDSGEWAGIPDIVTLFRYECRCGWLSGMLLRLPGHLACRSCKRTDPHDFVRYGLVQGEWLKIDEWRSAPGR